MSSAREHYQHHLAAFYSWMAGDFKTQSKAFIEFLQQHNISGYGQELAIDLGAGHGIQSAALAEQGFDVVSVDFNPSLLGELRQNLDGLRVKTIEADIRDYAATLSGPVALICCGGDTLAHFDSFSEVDLFLRNCCRALQPESRLLLSFRDYSQALNGDARFIPVKSDAERILTCVLDYGADSVTVTDLLHERVNGEWKQKVSSYDKLRLKPQTIISQLKNCGMTIDLSATLNRQITILATRIA